MRIFIDSLLLIIEVCDSQSCKISNQFIKINWMRLHYLALVEGAIKDLLVTRLGRLYMKLPPRRPFISTLLM